MLVINSEATVCFVVSYVTSIRYINIGKFSDVTPNMTDVMCVKRKHPKKTREEKDELSLDNFRNLL